MHSTTVAAEPHPKSSCLLQRSLDSYSRCLLFALRSASDNRRARPVRVSGRNSVASRLGKAFKMIGHPCEPHNGWSEPVAPDHVDGVSDNLPTRRARKMVRVRERDVWGQDSAASASEGRIEPYGLWQIVKAAVSSKRVIPLANFERVTPRSTQILLRSGLRSSHYRGHAAQKCANENGPSHR